MDVDEVRRIIRVGGGDVWGLIDAAIIVAASDNANELKYRRDSIVERLYSHCPNCDLVPNTNPLPLPLPQQHQQLNKAVTQGQGQGEDDDDELGGDSPLTPQSVNRILDDDQVLVAEEEDDEEEIDPCAGLFDDDDEEARILSIKQQLEDPHLSDDSLADLLQTLADMDLTFKTLKETDIGRNVNRLRKHPSNHVRGLVKELVRKWKDLVDEWVGSKHTRDAPIIPSDADSPLLHNTPKKRQNDHLQVPEFAYSPNPHNGSSGSEPEQRSKATIPKRDAPSKPLQKFPASSSAPPPNRAHKETSIDLDKLASARRRLHENYQEAKNAKKQRTIQVMDIHEIPKPKNGFIAKNKGGFQGRHHR